MISNKLIMSKIGPTFIEKAQVMVLLAASLMLRPTIFGQNFSIYAVPLFIIAFLLEGLKGGDPKIKIWYNRKLVAVYAIVVVLWVFLLLQATANWGYHYNFVIKAFFINIFPITICFVLLSNSRISYLYFRWFLILLAIPAASYIITVIAVQFITPESLRYFQISIEGYSHTNSGSILLPITPVYSFITVNGYSLLRFQDLFRESGIAQAFLAWGFIVARNLFVRRWAVRTIRLLMLIGIIGTLSTIGLALIPIIIMLSIILDSKIMRDERRRFTLTKTLKISIIGIITILAIGVGLLGVQNIPGIGLEHKIDSVSGETRLVSTQIGLKKFLKNPIGVGLYNAHRKNASINLIAVLSEIGIFGVFLYLLVFFIAIYYDENPSLIMAALIPILATSITSQPLVDAPLLYITLLYGSGVASRKYFKNKINPDCHNKN